MYPFLFEVDFCCWCLRMAIVHSKSNNVTNCLCWPWKFFHIYRLQKYIDIIWWKIYTHVRKGFILKEAISSEQGHVACHYLHQVGGSKFICFEVQFWVETWEKLLSVCLTSFLLKIEASTFKHTHALETLLRTHLPSRWKHGWLIARCTSLEIQILVQTSCGEDWFCIRICLQSYNSILASDWLGKSYVKDLHPQKDEIPQVRKKNVFSFFSAGGDGEKDLEEEESQIKQNVLEKEQDTARLNKFLEKAGQVKDGFNLLVV